MVPNNKILTVAYGTFSCTLEGFDDPFSAMTEIAEYFRDLAADDRFFGAEPPTPDMVTLRSIAEARARHSVEASEDGNSVTLRPAVAPAAAEVVDEADDVDAMVFARKDTSEDDASAEVEDDISAEVEEAIEEDFADAEAALDEIEEPEATVEDADTQEAVAEEASPEIEAADVVDEDDADDTESMEAKLARIRDVVDANDVSTSYGEEEQLDEILTDTVVTGADEPVDDSMDVEADGADTVEADVAAALNLSDADADDTAEIDAEDVKAQDADEAETATETTSVVTDAEEKKTRFFRVRKKRRAEAAAVATEADAGTETETEAVAEDDAEDLESDDLMASLSDEAETTEVDAAEGDLDDEDDLMAELAAIEAELDRDPVGASKDDDDDALAAALDDDDESDDLMNQLAAIRAEDEDDAPTSDAAEEVAEDEEADFDEDDDATLPSDPDMERLFAATDSRLSGEDTSRRHANISHLKAAVAARRADGPIEPKDDSDTDAYRADLANSVRPRRAPTPPEEERTSRPERPSPLVLVSEQRVEPQPDGDAAKDDAQEPAAKAADGEDFELFAAEVGAFDLPDVLEAAAVYSSKVLGQDNFSRPRLLHLASEAFADLSREDGLRGFGQLLRDGKIRKVNRGTFALAIESRYTAEAERRAG